MKSKSKLFTLLQEFNPERFKDALEKYSRNGKGRYYPNAHVGDETYGHKSMMYIYWGNEDTAKEGEIFLKKNGFNPTSYIKSNPTTSEVQVSYFKGWHWDE